MVNIPRTGTSHSNTALASFSCCNLPSENGNCSLATQGYVIIASLCSLVKQLRNMTAFTAGYEQHAINQDQGHTYQMSANEIAELGSDREKLAAKNNTS